MIEPPSSQRSATRAPIDRPIRLQFDDSLDVDEGHCINISIGGMFVHAEAPRPPGTLVRFELPLSDVLSIRGLGEVVWQQRADTHNKGVGIKFRFLEQRDRQQIFKLVSQHIKARLEREGEVPPHDLDAPPEAPEAAAFTRPAVTAEADLDAAGSPLEPPAPVSGEAAATPPLEAAGAAADDGEPASAGAAAAAGDAAPSLFDRWQQPETDLETMPAEAWDADPPPEVVAPAWTPEGLETPDDVPDASRHSPAPVPRRSSRRRRARRDSSWLIAVVLTVVVAAGAAYLLRDRLFSGLVAADREAPAASPPAVPDDAGSVSDQRPDSDRPAAADPGSGDRGSSDPGDRGTATDLGSSDRGSSGDETTASGAAAPPPPRSAIVPPPTLPVASPPAVEPPPPAAAPPPPRIVDTPTEPLPGSSRAAGRVEDIRWRLDEGRLRVTVALDGSITDARIKRFRLGGESTREVVVLLAMAAPYRQTQMAVGAGGVDGIRTGFHRKPQGDEVHIVLDLADVGKTVTEVRARGDRVEIVVGDASAAAGR